MAKKQLVLEEDTRVTFNKAMAKIMKDKPEIIRLTDDFAVKIFGNNAVEC